jgi:3-oxoacyl-[acyl-carrier-protein] synthase-3
MVADVLARGDLKIGDIDCVIAHQPNPVALRALGRELGIDADRLVITGDEVGNIGAASAAYALTSAVAQGRVRPGHQVLIVVFGAGMTWGTALLRWTGARAVQTGPVKARTGAVPPPDDPQDSQDLQNSHAAQERTGS